jgi:hypothetical protein
MNRVMLSVKSFLWLLFDFTMVCLCITAYSIGMFIGLMYTSLCNVMGIDIGMQCDCEEEEEEQTNKNNGDFWMN